MEDFTRESKASIQDDYSREVQGRSIKKIREGIVAKEYQSLEGQDINSFSKKVAYGKQRVYNALKIWGSLFFVVGNSCLVYPITVKLVRTLGIRGYFNIHFVMYVLLSIGRIPHHSELECSHIGSDQRMLQQPSLQPTV